MKGALIGVALLLALGGLAAGGLYFVRPDLFPGGEAAGGDDSGLYCKEHGVPEKFCTLCHEELKKALLLCKEHGDIPEDICTLCHPEVQGIHKIEICPNGHKLPKHFCYECAANSSSSLDAPGDGWCSGHNQPEEWCGECRALVESKAPIPAECRQKLPVVRLASAELAGKIGLEVAEASEDRDVGVLLANAEVAFEETKYAVITPRVAGYLVDPKVDVGQAVARDEVIALIDSHEVAVAKSAYLSARAHLELAQAEADRAITLGQGDSIARKLVLEATTALEHAKNEASEAEQTLRNWFIGDAEIARIAKGRETAGTLAIRAPFAGIIVARKAARGAAIAPDAPLFAIADLDRMWVWIDIYEADLDRIAVGMPVRFVPNGRAKAAYEGKLTWIGAEVDPVTRAVRARAEVPNPGGKLRANQFGKAEIRVDDRAAVVVPKLAVQRKDDADLVFLPAGDGAYRPQRIVTLPTNRPDVLEVAWGLKAGQPVVTRGSYWLKTEIMRGSIGAGCCE